MCHDFLKRFRSISRTVRVLKLSIPTLPRGIRHIIALG
ncbi:MAG: hypothetical protein OJF47_001589 [Nitrospira sp.]|nr:MAG: hypothetical protein OJF47_001589 [Nitrospira sp.]